MLHGNRIIVNSRFGGERSRVFFFHSRTPHTAVSTARARAPPRPPAGRAPGRCHADRLYGFTCLLPFMVYPLYPDLACAFSCITQRDKVPCCRRINGVTRPVHVANWHHNHRTGPPRPSGDREIVGRMERISKGVGWRGVQPEWCMRCSSASTCTALALTVRHASARQERYASCTKLS